MVLMSGRGSGLELRPEEWGEGRGGGFTSDE